MNNPARYVLKCFPQDYFPSDSIFKNPQQRADFYEFIKLARYVNPEDYVMKLRNFPSLQGPPGIETAARDYCGALMACRKFGIYEEIVLSPGQKCLFIVEENGKICGTVEFSSYSPEHVPDPLIIDLITSRGKSLPDNLLDFLLDKKLHDLHLLSLSEMQLIQARQFLAHEKLRKATAANAEEKN